MITKYSEEKRNSILICSSSVEKFSQYKKLDDNNVVLILKTKYSKDKAQSIPYHYVVTTNGIINIKSPNLLHLDESYLSVFNHDIKILLLNDELLISQKKEIAKLVAELAEKYSMQISDKLQLIGNTDSKYAEAMTNLIFESINIRNELNPILKIFECVVDDAVVVNSNILIDNNRNGYSSISIFSDKYNIPVEVLHDLNPHLNYDNLKITDTIFIPKTIAIAGLNEAISAQKQANLMVTSNAQRIKEVLYSG